MNRYMYKALSLVKDPEYKNLPLAVTAEYEESGEIYIQSKALFVLTLGTTLVAGASTLTSFIAGNPSEISLFTTVGTVAGTVLSVLDYKLLNKTKLKFDTARNKCNDELYKKYNTSKTGWIGIEMY